MIYSAENKPTSGAQVGNKSFYLHEIASVCSVPSFITLGTDSFRELLELEQNRKLKDLITQVFLNKLGIVFKLNDIQQEIDEMYIPGTFVDTLKTALLQNGVMPPYAVRSSSTMEDGQKKSAAGIYESYCNVSDDMLLQRIKDCWKSNFTVRSLCYEEITDDIDKRISSMGVIIQHFVSNATLAGVYFSVDPVSPESGAVVEYVEGTAEELMSGMKTPVSVSLGFYKEGADRSFYRFDDEWMFELQNAGGRLARMFDCNVDVEWVFADDKIYIIQCRPITTLGEVSHNEWIVPVSKAASIPVEERGGLGDYVNHLKKKKIPFYCACEKCEIVPIGWYFLRYGVGSDINAITADIVHRCGNGFYAIMFNKMLLDFQCDDTGLADKLREILELSAQDYVTISIKYIPHNEMSCISYYNPADESVRIEAVPGIMKGIKSGYLKPTTFVLDEKDKVIFSCKEHYSSYYDIDLATDTFFEPQVDMYIYDEVAKYVETIADATRQLHKSGILGDIEWWVCDRRLFATDYSIEKRDENEKESTDIRRISSGDIVGNVFCPDAQILSELEYLSYGCSISADEYDERVNELEVINRMYRIIDEYKKNNQRCILAIPRPLLGLSPVLDKVDGVILESASRLCHLSVIIREKKIPAIEIGEEFAKLEDRQYVEYRE